MKKNLIITLILISVLVVTLWATPALRQDIVEFLSISYSQRNFVETPITDEKIQKILEAGHRAGSAGNLQPWHFTVIRNKELINDIMTGVTDENVLIVVSGPREHPRGFSVEFDTALATQKMFTAAQALSLGARMYVRPIRNLNENLLDRLDLPEDFHAVMILRVGHIDVDAVSTASPRQPLESKVNFIN